MAVKKPNVLMIITDQQSCDAMSWRMGGDYLETPAMDSIAAGGVSFGRAYCAFPLCVPSRASMFTGRYPHEIDVMDNNLSRDMAAFPCLGRVFQEAGYDTGYVGKWHLPYPENDRRAHGFNSMSNIRSNGADPGNAEEALRFMRSEREGPFFLTVSFNNPHNICEWARGGRGKLPDAEIGPPPPAEQCPPMKSNHLPEKDEAEAVTLMRRSFHASPTFPVGSFGEEEWRQYLWAYHRMVESVDRRLAVILEELESSGRKGDTILVFTADHGDSQGAHRWNQKTVLYDESCRVPFMISFPRELSSGESSRLANTGIDLMPTLCALAGIAPPGELRGANLLDGEEREWIVTETHFFQGGEVDGRVPRAEGRMLRSRRYKYCAYDIGGRRESLNDMENDPGETVNLAGKIAYAEVLEEHRGYLREFCRQTGDSFPVPPRGASV